MKFPTKFPPHTLHATWVEDEGVRLELVCPHEWFKTPCPHLGGSLPCYVIEWFDEVEPEEIIIGELSGPPPWDLEVLWSQAVGLILQGQT